MAKAITTKSESFTIRVPTDLMAKLKRLAETQNMTLTAIALERLGRDEPRPVDAAVHVPRTPVTERPETEHPQNEPPVSPVVPPNLTGKAVNPRLKGSWTPRGKAHT